MFCPKCGTMVADGVAVCSSCGAQVSAAVPAPSARIENHLTGAILTTLCCCMPFGIVSIVYAAKVNGLVAAGDLVGAQKAADQAKTWITWGVGIGLGLQLLNLLIQVIIQILAVVAAQG